MTTYMTLPPVGSLYWGDPVATSSALPTTDPIGMVRLTLDTKTAYEWSGSSWTAITSATVVSGPVSSTDNAVARFDGTAGNAIQNSSVIIDDSGNASGLGTVSSGEVTSSSLTASRALVSGGSKQIQSSSVTSTELGYLSGATSAVQTQLDGMAKLAGRSGGQTLDGDTASGGNLTFSSTAHATKGKINLGASSAYDEANTRLGLGLTSPTQTLDVKGNVRIYDSTASTGQTNVVIRAGADNLGSGIDILNIVRASDGSTADTDAVNVRQSGSQVKLNAPLFACQASVWMDGSKVRLGNSTVLNFTSGGPTASNGDVGLSRDSAGLIRISDGSTGYGSLDIQQMTVQADPSSNLQVATKQYVDAKVTGPGSATDEAITRYDGTTGKLVQNSAVTISDAGGMTFTGTTGFLKLPVLTTTQRDALTAANGMVIYNSSTDRFQGYAAGSWVDLHGWGA